jgi:hypothetical protein
LQFYPPLKEYSFTLTLRNYCTRELSTDSKACPSTFTKKKIKIRNNYQHLNLIRSEQNKTRTSLDNKKSYKAISLFKKILKTYSSSNFHIQLCHEDWARQRGQRGQRRRVRRWQLHQPLQLRRVPPAGLNEKKTSSNCKKTWKKHLYRRRNNIEDTLRRNHFKFKLNFGRALRFLADNFFDMYILYLLFLSLKYVLMLLFKALFRVRLINILIITIFRISVALNTFIRLLKYISYNLCCCEKYSRPCLDLFLGSRFLTLNPMKQQSCDTSIYWLCRQIFMISQKNFIKKNFTKIYLILESNLLNLSCRQATTLALLILMHDVEPNRGPLTSIIENNHNLDIYTINCRGLGKLNKFRLFLSKASDLLRLNPHSIIMVQETMVKDDNYLKMAWKGEYVITSGTGNSQGCITLLNSGVAITNKIDIDNRGHFFELTGLTKSKIGVINIYAPNGYASNKRDFFLETFQLIENSICDNIILAGDFNLTFSDNDRHRRMAGQGEIYLSHFVANKLDELELNDTWQNYSGMTWKRGNTMSRLDRIYTRLRNFKQSNIKTNWTFCETDHVLVHATLNPMNKRVTGPKICRLDPQVVLNPDSLNILRAYLVSQLETLDAAANPHLQLEFAKMTVRTKALELGRKLMNEERINLELLNEDILRHERLLEQAENLEEESEIAEHIERQTNEKNKILDEQGKKLAWKLKTKWYGEGEKSNKYFLNLLRRNTNRSEMSELIIGGNRVNDTKTVNEAVNTFYKNLYNQNSKISINNETQQFLNEMFNVDENEANHINGQITLTELWQALKPLKDTAPGPDGISHIYLKKLWDILGPLILNAWHFSINIDKLAPSHTTSYLRLIPKNNTDPLLLKNWRPITLSNFDHKLITRVYNNRLVTVLEKYIMKTQTAYIKHRNITDNICIISNAIQLANYEPNIEGSVIALDAQKAFDSVNHDYLGLVLTRVGLSNFVPIFRLLYRDLVNDTVINGRTIGRHAVNNGVKQGDALSCTLFILAIEPLMRNIEKNANIKSLKSNMLDFVWPKVLGYADDITCLTVNQDRGKQEVFKLYEKFSNISGLYLNAEKTEILNFSSNGPAAHEASDIIRYCGQDYDIVPVKKIKINGLYLCQNRPQQSAINCCSLIEKMENHFVNWQKRNLSLLGKIQIYKTLGLSQFLYHLAVIEPDLANWKLINSKISKFLWNRKMTNNQAPARIKKETLLTPINRGGFGMIEIKEVVSALRLKRHLYLMEQDVHPLHGLLKKLTQNTTYLCQEPELEIDEIVNLNLKTLVCKRISDCKAPEWELESDLTLHTYLLGAKISDMTRLRKRQSNEANQL